MKSKMQRMCIIFTFVIITMPITNNYASPLNSIGIGEFILLILIPIMFLNMFVNKYNLTIHSYWVFFLYGIIISLLMLLFHPGFVIYDVIIRLLRDTFYVVVIFIFIQRYFNIEFALKVYKYLSIFSCAYLILQCLSFYIFNHILPWILPGLNLNYSITNVTEYLNEYSNMYGYYFRPTSIFVEPSYFAQFVSPYLVLTLFPCISYKKINYRMAIFLSVSLLMSTSANAYVLVFLIWFIWVLHQCQATKNHKNIFVIIFLTIIGVVFIIFLYNNNNSFNYVLNRIMNIGKDGDISSNARILRGIYIFGSLNFVYKVFGIGFGNYDSFSILYNIVDKFNMTSDYMNTISYILVSSGLIGLSMYLLVIYKMYKNASLSAKVLIILLLVMCLSTGIYSSPMYIVIFAFILNIS